MKHKIYKAIVLTLILVVYSLKPVSTVFTSILSPLLKPLNDVGKLIVQKEYADISFLILVDLIPAIYVLYHLSEKKKGVIKNIGVST